MIGFGEVVEIMVGDMLVCYVIYVVMMELGGLILGEIIIVVIVVILWKVDEFGCCLLVLVVFGMGVGGFLFDDVVWLMVGVVCWYWLGLL